MTQAEDIFDNPTGWVARHIRRYVETDGRQGQDYARYQARTSRKIPVVVLERA